MEEFTSLLNNRISYLQRLDGPVMGWSSVYTPEEIIYAAGIAPFGVTGEGEP